jgi:hypothetical protein
MKGLKIRVPDAPAYMATPKACNANPTPIAFAEVYPGAAERHRRRPGKSADDDRGEILRGAEEHPAHRAHHRRPDHADRPPRLEQAQRGRPQGLRRGDPGGSRPRVEQIIKREGELVDEFKRGLNVATINRQSFIDAVLKSNTPESLGYERRD